MSTLAGVVGVQHNPLLYRTLVNPADDDLVAVRDAFAETAERIRAARPDVIVVVATDHLTQWFYENMPTFLVGRSDVIPATFPNEEREFGLPQATLTGDLGVAAWLHEDGIRQGFDLAASDDFRADHSILVPLHFLTPGFDVPVVPMFTNAIAPPFPSAARFFELGQAIRAASSPALSTAGCWCWPAGTSPPRSAGRGSSRGHPTRSSTGPPSTWSRGATPASSGRRQLRAPARGRQRDPPVPQLRGGDGGGSGPPGDGGRGQAVALRDVAVLRVGRGGTVMSRYAVNAFMRLVNMDHDETAAYVADPTGFVRRWVAAQDRAVLSDDEQTALERRDYGALYAMGAHPYLLWSFTEAVWVPEVARPDLVESFRTAAAAVGYPDCRTVPPPTLL